MRTLVFSLCLLVFAGANFAADATSQRGLVLLIDQKNLPSAINSTWDTIRSWRISLMNAHMYDHVYHVKGDDCRNTEHLKKIWQQAFDENDDVDYVSMVHGGGQFIDDLDIPEDNKKLRLVYTEGCHGAASLEQFVTKYGAIAAVGHKGLSASPFFSFKFLNAWTSDLPLEQAIESAWADAKEDCKGTIWSGICKLMIPSYKDSQHIITETTPVYVVRGDVNLNKFSIKTSFADFVRNLDEETVRKEMSDDTL